jgi:galactokinase
VILGNIFNGLFNSGMVAPLEIALIGQYAENIYMGKPCGLMDQVACSCGGIVTIDFAEPKNPKVEQIAFDLASHGYTLLVIDTKGHHANLTPEYASIPEEMRAVARFFGKEQMRQVSAETFYSSIADIRPACGDRAVLRAHHFIRENRRVADQVEALKKDDFGAFLSMVNDSGSSSWKYLQNISAGGSVKEQEVALALALTEDFISRTGEGACRVHGGGFAGTILVFLPNKSVAAYIEETEHLFGEGAVAALGFRSRGGEMLPLLSG